MQFPVSSGQHHRKGEDWRPVSPTPPPSVPVPQKKLEIPVPVALPSIPVIPTSSIPLPPEPANPMGSLIQPQIELSIQSPNTSVGQTLTVSGNVSM